MPNWYKKHFYKIARRGTGVPLMEEYTTLGKPDDEVSEPKNLTKANPFFGGNERNTSDGKGYPKNISLFEDSDYKNEGVVQEIPSGRTQLDDEISIGEGVNDERFADPIDRPGKLQSEEPVGIHNMQDKNIFDYVSKTLKIKNLNKV